MPKPCRIVRVALSGTVLTLMVLPLLASPAAAHAELVSSTPAASTSLVQPPAEVELTFSEPIDLATAVVELLDPSQNAVPGIGEPALDQRGVVVTVQLPALDPGVYTVSYQVVSAVDGHATAGLFAFVVDPTGTEAPPPIGPSSTSPSVDAPTVASRWVALAALLVALGSLVMWWNAGLPVLAREAPGADPRPPWLLIGFSSGVAFVGLALYLTLAARPIVAALGAGDGNNGGAGFSLDFAAPFGWTPFAVAMRVALAACAAGFALGLSRFFAGRGRVGGGEDRRWALVAGVVLAVAVAGMSMAGHAAATGGPAFGALDWIHLASVAAWLGALPAALVLARRMDDGGGRALRGILRRHARVAMVAAPVTALTGLANSTVVLGASRDVVASDYGNLLLAKVILLSVGLGMGAVNHLALRSRSRVNVPLLVGVDLVVALLAVLVGATMVTIQPAAARQPVLVTAPQNPAHLFGTAGPSAIHTAVSLPGPGRQTYRVWVTEPAGGEQPDVQKVFLTFTPPGPGLATQRVELTPADAPGQYGATGAYTPIEGTWTLEVIVRRAGVLDESVAFELPVAAPEPPELAPPPDTGVGTPAPLAILWGVLPSGPAAWLPALLAVAAIGVTAWWARRPGAPPWVSPTRLALVGLLAVVALGAGSRALVTAANAPYVASVEENPIPADPESVARGERLYLANCASCHGIHGSGDGPLVTLPQAGALSEVVRATSDGELSYRIAVGIAGTPMPAFAGTLTPEERWHLVNYLGDRWGGP